MSTENDKITILIVDHTPVILQALVRWVQQIERFRLVGAVANINDAIKMEHELQPQVILYGLSVLMPYSLEQLPHLRRKLPESYIIATSWEPHDESRAPALAAGANDYVSGFKLDTDLLPAILRGTRNES
jgi:DNA-binding NarL/FixJ family response regulator